MSHAQYGCLNNTPINQTQAAGRQSPKFKQSELIEAYPVFNSTLLSNSLAVCRLQCASTAMTLQRFTEVATPKVGLGIDYL